MDNMRWAGCLVGVDGLYLGGESSWLVASVCDAGGTGSHGARVFVRAFFGLCG